MVSMTIDPIDLVDPVALLTSTLAGLSRKQQAATLERVMRVYVRICHEAYPTMSLEEIAGQFGAIAEAATARLAEKRAALEMRVTSARLAQMITAASARSQTT
jgi:hypothetical protein